jgi:hypothetical protein
MKLSRHSLMAAVLMASGLVFTTLGSAHAQRATYRTVSGHGGHGYGHGCPCPTDCPPSDIAEEAGPGEEGMEDDMGEDLPEVADLTSDAGMASADQSAAPNAIGDSLPPGITIDVDLGGIGPDFNGTFAPAGGRRFKATNNNSAIPQCRAFFNYNHYENAYSITDQNPTPDVVRDINVDHYELGGEHTFWCGMASIQVRVPVNTSLDSTIDLDQANPFGDDTELGNINVSLKAVLYQDCCKTVSLGLGVDLPTADDILVTQASDDFVFSFDNDAVVLSPYLAAYNQLGCNAFLNSFAQVAIPVNENDVAFSDDPNTPALTGELADSTLLYLDASLGYWLRRDCCGNGIAAIAELHYTNALTDDELILDANDVELRTGSYETLNATVGAVVVNGCWSVAPAIVLPLLDSPDRSFDYEIAVYVNRRF